MRKITYGGASSLDALIAGPHEEIDWIRRSDDTAELMKEIWRGVDTMLMGRKSYEFALRMGGPIQWGRIKTYFFSRTLETVEGGAELVRTNAVEFVRKLKEQDGGDIVVMGGGELGASLVDAGLVDEVSFTIQPVLLGQGTPAFTGLTRRVDLELIETRAMSEGCVLVRYRVLQPWRAAANVHNVHARGVHSTAETSQRSHTYARTRARELSRNAANAASLRVRGGRTCARGAAGTLRVNSGRRRSIGEDRPQKGCCRTGFSPRRTDGRFRRKERGAIV